ncbi:MAG TPA: deoxyribonuclease IV [Bacteroidaceae bacterium]|nr:deoxyribonuclease IV [Bacteroidaceae bacterium]
MKHIGPHVSASGGVSNAPLNAHSVGANAFALFIKNQRQWFSAPLKSDEIERFKAACREHSFSPEYILPHSSYLINLGSPDPDALEKSRNSFFEEMSRCEQLGLTMLNFHPGSHLNKITPEECINRVSKSINMALERSEGVTAVIENTAGQGSNMGFEFGQIGAIIDGVDDKSRVGVCIDTCHTYTSGYDLVNHYDDVWREFEEVIGLNYLKGLHLNDSKKELGSRVDRHDSIGKGLMGIDFFKRIMKDSRFDNIPIILETPDELAWAAEIELLRSFE